MRKSILCIAALLAACLLLASCSGGLVTLKYEDGMFKNNAKKLAYFPAPVSYEPVSVGEAYAYYKKGKITMYEIPGSDPTLWLTEEYADAATTVFYSETLTLPTLDNFGADTLYVCISEERTFAAFTIDDEELLADLIDTVVNGAAAEAPNGEALEVYDMKFASPDWPMIYICLEYEEYEDGAYLYDRNTRKYTAIGDMLADILHEGEA